MLWQFHVFFYVRWPGLESYASVRFSLLLIFVLFVFHYCDISLCYVIVTECGSKAFKTSFVSIEHDARTEAENNGSLRLQLSKTCIFSHRMLMPLNLVGIVFTLCLYKLAVDFLLLFSVCFLLRLSIVWHRFLAFCHSFPFFYVSWYYFSFLSS